MAGPHRNERFYGYPTCRVLAVLGTDESLARALDALDAAGVDLDGVDVLSGPAGADLLDVDGSAHGLHGRLIRLVQDLAFERDRLARYEPHLRAGRHLLVVPAAGRRSSQQVRELLAADGAVDLMWFGPGTVVDLAVPGDTPSPVPAPRQVTGGRPSGWISRREADELLPAAQPTAPEERPAPR